MEADKKPMGARMPPDHKATRNGRAIINRIIDKYLSHGFARVGIEVTVKNGSITNIKEQGEFSYKTT